MIAALDHAGAADNNKRNKERKPQEVMRGRDHRRRLRHYHVLGNDCDCFVENRKHWTAVARPNLACGRDAQNRSNQQY
jgi:hypothetical protein